MAAGARNREIGLLAVWGMLLAGVAMAATPSAGDAPGVRLRSLVRANRGEAGSERLSPELQVLYDQFRRGPGERQRQIFSEEDLRRLFGIEANDPDPWVAVVIRVEPGTESAVLKGAGAAVQYRVEDMVRARVKATELVHLARARGVISMGALYAMRPLQPPALFPSGPPAQPA